MEHQHQLKVDNCGQTCVAMVAGVSQWDAMNAVGIDDGGTNPTLLKRALWNFGFNVEMRRGHGKEWPPKLALLFIRWDGKSFGHVAVLRDGQVHDPGLKEVVSLEEYEDIILPVLRGRIRSHLVVGGKRY